MRGSALIVSCTLFLTACGGSSEEPVAAIPADAPLADPASEAAAAAFADTALAPVGGQAALPNVATISGTCTTCHDAPNVGNHSVPLPLDIGVADASRRTPDMPLYTLRNKTTGQTVQTTDPGRAMISGKWNDIARFKGPILRGLAGRAPYFHNGSAKDLNEVVGFYDTRFGMGLTEDEKNDLVAFLRAL